METYLNTWLVGLSVEVDGTEMMVYYLISATDLEHAEAGVLEMGRTWWPALKRGDDGIGGSIPAVWSGLTALFCSTMWRTVSCAA